MAPTAVISSDPQISISNKSQCTIIQPIDKNDTYEQHASILQIFSAFVALLGAMSLGCVLSYTSPAIPSMHEDIVNADANSNLTNNITNHPFLNDKYIESWIISVINLSALAGALSTGFFVEYIGHTRFLCISAFFCSIGWLIIAVASTAMQVLIGRIVTGLCIGFVSSSVPVYVVDIATQKTRGFLGCAFQGMITVGFLFISIAATWLNWRWLAALCILPTAIMTCLIPFMPESPHWLLRKRRTVQAQESLQKLRTICSDVSAELASIQEHEIHSNDNEQLGDKQSSRSLWSDLHDPCVWKPLVIGVMLMFYAQMCGANGLIGCLQSILIRSGTSLQPKLMAVLINISLAFSAWFTTVVVNRLGRLTLLSISSIGYTIAFIFLVIFYTNDVYFIGHALFRWLPVIALFIFFTVHGIGFGGIPWFLIPELSVNAHRSHIAAICTTVNYILSFLVMKNFVPMLEQIGEQALFSIFACISISSAAFLLFCVPETKGKSSVQIRTILRGH